MTETYRRMCTAALLLLGLATVACRNPTRDDGRACEQTYEFGNYGCAEVRGQILGSHGLPLGGVLVVPIYLGDEGAYDTPTATTKGDGRFSLRFRRFGPPMSSSDPDAVDLYLVAVTPVRDSVLVNLRLTPIGTVPTPATVTIRLAYP